MNQNSWPVVGVFAFVAFYYVLDLMWVSAAGGLLAVGVWYTVPIWMENRQEEDETA